jgi:hypothetical protein
VQGAAVGGQTFRKAYILEIRAAAT